MKIDQHPFPTNMVDIGGKKNALQTKLLMSQSAKESGAVDPKAQISADDVKGKKPQEQVECSAAPQRRVTSQMLLNKFQCDHEKLQYREETMRRKEEHWRCPFFVHCWEEGLTLPLADDCPECNGLYRDSRSYKKPRFDDGPRGPVIRERREYERCIPIHDRLGGRIPVHDQLGGKSMLRDSSEGRIHVHDQLEQMANDLVLDDQPLHRDPEREPFNHRVDRPRWCPAGLTKSQKRRVQRLRQWEILEEE